MEFELVENFTNTTIKEETIHMPPAINVTYGVALLIVCLISACIDVIMVYSVFNFSKLRTVPYIFLANLSIADLYTAVLTPIDFFIFPYVDYDSVTYYVLSCLYELQCIFLNTVLFFVTSLAVDWLLASYFTKASESYRRRYKVVVTTIWVLTLIGVCISFTLRLYDLLFYLPLLVLAFTYLGLFIFIIILQAVRLLKWCRRRSSNYPTLTLTIATVYLLLWILSAIPDILGRNFLFLTLIGYLTNVVIFIVLYRGSTNFQACIRQLLKRSGDRYTDDIPDYQIPRSESNDIQNTQVFFIKNNEDVGNTN